MAIFVVIASVRCTLGTTRFEMTILNGGGKPIS